MELNPIIEAVKLVLRLAILWTPLLLALLVDIGNEGLFAGLSIFLTAADKVIHESKKYNINGIIPF